MGALASGHWPGLLGLTGLPTAQTDLREEVGGLPLVGSGSKQRAPASGTSCHCAPPNPPSLVLAPGKSREGLCLGPLCPS